MTPWLQANPLIPPMSLLFLVTNIRPHHPYLFHHTQDTMTTGSWMQRARGLLGAWGPPSPYAPSARLPSGRLQVHMAVLPSVSRRSVEMRAECLIVGPPSCAQALLRPRRWTEGAGSGGAVFPQTAREEKGDTADRPIRQHREPMGGLDASRPGRRLTWETDDRCRLPSPRSTAGQEAGLSICLKSFTRAGQATALKQLTDEAWFVRPLCSAQTPPCALQRCDAVEWDGQRDLPLRPLNEQSRDDAGVTGRPSSSPPPARMSAPSSQRLATQH
ncbi:hypothetical protein AAFF_G00053290 [Aldrovandia affinis]|uniref:Uncharacterized protein n=1 Tax=Aldrovandia affinis TaxID=143900 RepID=A0AAD7T4Y2_9TELE|nr:hypothetical protein AAFF_G00053290 [Aldrovandia affinis]